MVGRHRKLAGPTLQKFFSNWPLPKPDRLIHLIRSVSVFSPASTFSPLEPPVQSSPQSARTRRLAEEPIPSLLLRLSLPAMVGMMTQGAYYFVDRVFVGQALNPDALAGITMAFPYMLVLLAAAMLIGFGAAAQVSIKLGEKKTEEAERVLGNAALLLLLFSVVLTVVGLALLDPVLNASRIPENVLHYAREYLQIVIFATGFQLVGFGLNAVIRAEGNTRTAMWTLLIGVFLNFFLAWLFLFKFHWGMRGAAWATAIAQCVSAAWVLAYFLQGKSLLHLRWRLPAVPRPDLRQDPADRFADVPHAAFRGPDVRLRDSASEKLWRGDGDCRLGRHLRTLYGGQHAGLRHQPGHAAHRRLQLRR